MEHTEMPLEFEEFKVRPGEYGGYDIYVNPDPNPFHAVDFTELMIALEHWGQPTQKMKLHPHKYENTNTECPLCRVVWSDNNNKTEGKQQ